MWHQHIPQYKIESKTIIGFDSFGYQPVPNMAEYAMFLEGYGYLLVMDLNAG